MLGDRVERMADSVRRCGRSYLNSDWISQDVLGQASYFGGHGSREKQRLARLWKMRQNSSDIGEKTHIEQLVSFVYYQHFQLGEIDGMTADMVQKSAGAGNDNIGTLQFLNLWVNTHATVNRNAFKAGFAPQDFDLLVNLFGQLSSGGHDQGTDAAVLMTHQSIQDRQNEGSRFAGAGLSQPHHIATLQDRRDCPSLNRGRDYITRF